MASPLITIQIDGMAVQLGTNISPVTLNVRANQPDDFTFAAPAGTIVPMNQKVQLFIDGVCRFSGMILDVQPSSSLAGMDLYTAYSMSEAAAAVQIATVRDTAAALRLAGLFAYNWEVDFSEFISLASQVYGDELRAVYAAPSSGVFSGTTAGRLPKIEVHGGSFPDLLSSVLANLPGHSWHWDPVTQAWNIYNALVAPVYTIQADRDALKNWGLRMSLRNRYSSVVAVGPPRTAPDCMAALLAPAWLPALEADWSWHKVTSSENADDPYNKELEAVYRRWSFANTLQEFNPVPEILTDAPVDLRQQVVISRDPERPDDPDGWEMGWLSVEIADIDWENAIVTSKMPMLRGVDAKSPGCLLPIERGASQPPLAAAFRFFVRLAIPPLNSRVGPSGDCFSRFRLTRELVVNDDLGVSQGNDESDRKLQERLDQRARLVHHCVSAPAITGTVPLQGYPPSWLWNLNCRVNIIVPGRRLHTDNMAAIVNSYSLDFANGGSTSIELTSDRSPMMGTTP